VLYHPCASPPSLSPSPSLFFCLFLSIDCDSITRTVATPPTKTTVPSSTLPTNFMVGSVVTVVVEAVEEEEVVRKEGPIMGKLNATSKIDNSERSSNKLEFDDIVGPTQSKRESWVRVVHDKARNSDRLPPVFFELEQLTIYYLALVTLNDPFSSADSFGIGFSRLRGEYSCRLMSGDASAYRKLEKVGEGKSCPTWPFSSSQSLRSIKYVYCRVWLVDFNQVCGVYLQAEPFEVASLHSSLKLTYCSPSSISS
jgi:hypothetical protein